MLLLSRERVTHHGLTGFYIARKYILTAFSVSVAALNTNCGLFYNCINHRRYKVKYKYKLGLMNSCFQSQKGWIVTLNTRSTVY